MPRSRSEESTIQSHSNLDRILVYHEATKHHPHRYAKSLGYLDWANQPNPFRRFEGAPIIDLVVGPRDFEPLYDALFNVSAIPSEPINRRTISEFLECSLGISAWKSYQTSTWALRCNPSSGNLHPTEGYLICGAVEGIAGEAGIYHYAPNDHVLERRHSFSAAEWLELFRANHGSASLTHATPFFLVGLTSIFWREAWKYGERAFRYCQHDVGHAIAALRFAAAMLGWRMRMMAIGDGDLSRLLGLDRINGTSRVEWEHAEALLVVSNADAPDVNLSTATITQIADGEWLGTPNRLSGEFVQWDIIDMVADATIRPLASGNQQTASNRPRSSDEKDPSLSTNATSREIILRRRSATDFDGQTHLGRDAFLQMLGRVLPGEDKTAPWDAIDWTPRIHLLMFVHLVDGLRPGLYALVRDAAKYDTLRAATKTDFAWERVADDPSNLYFLMEADCRRAAAQLSLGQEIGGTSAFSLGMIAEFDASLTEFGPWFYRRLFWEAGMIGQTLYLEAEAAAIRAGNELRATGIGAYFDDPVHDVFGLTGHAFQDLYHFTIGGAVDDPRLTTRPPYNEAVTGRRKPERRG